MIINVNRKELLAHMKKATKASVAAGHPLMVLTGVLLEADGRSGVLRITATNLEISIRSTMPAAVEKDGSAVVDAKFLLGALNVLPGEDVYMELRENDQFYISSGQAYYLVSALRRKDYPEVEIPYPGDTVTAKGLKSLITRSVFAAASPNPVKPALSCVKLMFSENGVQAIGADGNCIVQVNGDPECKGNLSILVPATSMKTLASLAADSDVYALGVTGNNGSVKNVVFSDGTMLFSARIVEGGYPNTDAVFDSITPVASASINADNLHRALDDIMSIAGSSGKIEFAFADNGLLLRYSGINGNAAIPLKAVVESATKEKYYFTLKNLSSIARLLKGEITLSFTKDKIVEIRSDAVRYIQIGLRPDAVMKTEKEAA